MRKGSTSGAITSAAARDALDRIRGDIELLEELGITPEIESLPSVIDVRSPVSREVKHESKRVQGTTE